MYISIDKNDLPNRFKFDIKIYSYLVSEFLKIVKNDYIDYFLSVYDVSKSDANKMVVITSNSKEYLIGISNPNTYINKDISDKVNEILSIEYGSVTKGYIAKPTVRKYCKSMTKLSRVMWIKYLHDIVLR